MKKTCLITLIAALAAIFIFDSVCIGSEAQEVAEWNRHEKALRITAENKGITVQTPYSYEENKKKNLNSINPYDIEDEEELIKAAISEKLKSDFYWNWNKCSIKIDKDAGSVNLLINLPPNYNLEIEKNHYNEDGTRVRNFINWTKKDIKVIKNNVDSLIKQALDGKDLFDSARQSPITIVGNEDIIATQVKEANLSKKYTDLTSTITFEPDLEEIINEDIFYISSEKNLALCNLFETFLIMILHFACFAIMYFGIKNKKIPAYIAIIAIILIVLYLWISSVYKTLAILSGILIVLHFQTKLIRLSRSGIILLSSLEGIAAGIFLNKNFMQNLDYLDWTSFGFMAINIPACICLFIGLIHLLASEKYERKFPYCYQTPLE